MWQYKKTWMTCCRCDCVSSVNVSLPASAATFELFAPRRLKLATRYTAATGQRERTRIGQCGNTNVSVSSV